MVRRFILRCLLLALPVLLAVVFHVVRNERYLPAPQVTTNFALNGKLMLAREASASGTEVLSIGSSMTLNNLASEQVTAHFGTQRYLNLGAWGTGASELAMIGPALVERLRPATVVVATNLMDFAGEHLLSPADSAAIVRFLDSRCLPWDYFVAWNGPYYLRQIEANKVRLNDPANYEYFDLDPFGGATLNVPPERIDRPRYELPPPAAGHVREERYAAFERFARYLHDGQVRLIVLHCAYRDGVRTPENDARMAHHVERLRRMLGPMGHTLVDANTEHWPDTLYVDSSHLGPEGARLFSAFCMARLAER